MSSVKDFFDKVGKNKFYIKIFKNPFTYLTGAVLLSIFQTVTLAVSGSPWGVSGAFTKWGSWLLQLVGVNVEQWPALSGAGAPAAFFSDPVSMRNIGIILGALAAALLASQFKFKKIKSMRQVVAAVLGGVLMCYGARVASGCNIGALFSGIASLSVSGWVFALFLLCGAWAGSKLLAKFFM